MSAEKGGFTLPGESGYEALTLKMAEKWGADVIRDSDGTKLSGEITRAGYGIYSTVCVIREHNAWAGAHREQLQQTFLCTPPVVALSESVEIPLMDSFFAEQFKVNDSAEAFPYWQVYDRTTDMPVPACSWTYHRERGVVAVAARPFHKYTVSFLAYRVWEEISMYNHTTNGWDKEHLMQIDPRYPEARAYLRQWMVSWCEAHPETTVVRFTSLFYNFAWIWGAGTRNRTLFSDWASYDFTVSARALTEFEAAYGYRLTAEDFINQGKLRATHLPGTKQKADWMAFISDFVVSFGRELVDIVHRFGKKAYVFYDDSWVGLEPYNGRFEEFGFDGLIKCVFSGFEARLCAGVDVPVHELRLHPYLFPVGLGGAPTFREGGDPAAEAKKYWMNVRRALLRAPVDRIGLGGYLHLAEGYPDFCDYIEKIAEEFRFIRSLHKKGSPYVIKTKVAVLHAWGKLRSWTLSGHFHETDAHDLIHINEALSGLPVDVSFLSFEDVCRGALEGVDVVINAGYAGSAWSGGDNWKDDTVVTMLTEWVYRGGAFLGVNEPSATGGFDTFFRMAHVLGVDEDTGERVCHGRFSFVAKDPEHILPTGVSLKQREDIYLTDGNARVLLEREGCPLVSVNEFGAGKGIYLSGFTVSPVHTRMLYQLIRYAGGEGTRGLYMTDNPYTECAYYPADGTLVIVNNGKKAQKTCVETETGSYGAAVEAYGAVVLTVSAGS